MCFRDGREWDPSSLGLLQDKYTVLQWGAGSSERRNYLPIPKSGPLQSEAELMALRAPVSALLGCVTLVAPPRIL